MMSPEIENEIAFLRQKVEAIDAEFIELKQREDAITQRRILQGGKRSAYLKAIAQLNASHPIESV